MTLRSRISPRSAGAFLALSLLAGAPDALANGEAKAPPKTSTGKELTGPGAHHEEYIVPPGSRDSTRDSARYADSTRGSGVRGSGAREPDSLRGSGSGPTRPGKPSRPTSPREPPEIPEGGRGGSPRPNVPGAPGTPGP